MDLILVMLLVLGVGSVKVFKTSKASEDNRMVMNADGSITSTGSSDSIPVGNNLTLRYEPDAFTLIIKELGLKK